VKKALQALVRRRDLLRTVAAGAAVVVTTSAAPVEPAAALPRNSGDKSRARYRANSAEVQEFYRVNRYPVR